MLWVTTLLAVAAGSFSLSMRRETGVVRNLVEAAQAEQLAEGGVRRGMLELLNPDQDSRWPRDGGIQDVEIGGASVQVAIRDEGGKVDINGAPSELLDGLLMVAGVEDDRRLVLVDAILDWRDPSEEHRLHGPSEADYRGAGYAYGPRNGPFRDIEELRLVYGMTTDLYARLAPWITVHTGAAGINPKVAPRTVLLALPGVEAAQVDSYLQQRRQHRESQLPPPAFAGTGGAYLSGASGIAYSVAAFARLPGGTQAGIEAVVGLVTGNPEQPFRVLGWRDWSGVSTAPE